ncbi:MAG TPA: hypothetical protein GXX75_02085 [Clostridiales bacterium]|nr:hypothetical protein [Clostridiales bacterium]
MRHKVTRLILGAVWVVISLVLFINGDSSRGSFFLLIGAAFLYSGFKIGRDGTR